MYISSGYYTAGTDKIIQVTVAFGVSGAIITFCFFDANRFLRRWYDRVLYFISCSLQKPILLPILLPGNFFRSFIALKERDGRQVYEIDEVEVTEFMLAV